MKYWTKEELFERVAELEKALKDIIEEFPNPKLPVTVAIKEIAIKATLQQDIEENFEYFNDCMPDYDIREFYKSVIETMVESYVKDERTRVLGILEDQQIALPKHSIAWVILENLKKLIEK